MTTRNDATRLQLRVAEPRRPRSVVARQGQVLLDADINQQATHLLDRVETGSDDTFGSTGRLVVPAYSTGFLVTPAAAPADCQIGPGRGYLGGWLVENVPNVCTVAKQPHPYKDSVATAPFVLVLKGLVRHVDPVEEPELADGALGDAQAAGRALVDWQVFPFKAATTPTCASVTTDANWTKLVAPSTGTLAVLPDTTPPATDPCSLAPAGGYSRAENLLYRIEVHGGTALAGRPGEDGQRYGLKGLKVKMSRRNASVMARITAVSGTQVAVETAGLDPLNWFTSGAYAEVVSRHDDLDARDAQTNDRLFRVAQSLDTVVTLESAAATPLASLKVTDGWFLRLWDAFPDGRGVVTVTTDADPARSQLIDLGDGLKAQVGAGTAPETIFRRGDYWTVAVRADGTVDWPNKVSETPHGPAIRYAPLAVVAAANAAEDCRIPLATLTDRTLLYRGGDGQAIPVPASGGFQPLPAKLRVAVMRGKTAVNGATVRWNIPDPLVNPACYIGGNPVTGSIGKITTTGSNGLCSVQWKIDSAQPGALHQVQATLLDPSGNPEGEPVMFTASFRTAAATSYESASCEVLSGATTVQEALDELCENLGTASEPETLRITSIRFIDEIDSTRDLVSGEEILNGDVVPYSAFRKGISIGISGPALEAFDETRHPVIEVELDLPYPTTDLDRLYWVQASKANHNDLPFITGSFGFTRIRLDGTVRVVADDTGHERRGLFWTPTEQAARFLETEPEHAFGYKMLDEAGLRRAGWKGEPRYNSVLCRLRIRSAHVWRGNGEGRVYLNAEHLGTQAETPVSNLLLFDRDPQRAADLDIFFYLQRYLR